MEYILGALKKYAVFSGRASRKEYWMFYLMFFLYSFLLFFVIGAAAATFHTEAKIVSAFMGGLLVLLLLGMIIPFVSMGVRRLHDSNSSGWWYLIAFVPYIGGIVLLVFFCMKGTTGPNRFGSDPYELEIPLAPETPAPLV